MTLCGGFSNFEEVTPEDTAVFQSCSPEDLQQLVTFLNSNGKQTQIGDLKELELLGVQKQVVAGMNYIFRVKIDDSTEVKVKVFKALECNGGNVEFTPEGITF